MIDYSSKHKVILKNREDGMQRKMDEPYFISKLIGDGIWQIESDGCITYMIEGNQESIVIDSGYGCGNVKDFCQSLTKNPIRRIINTHDHFDHTALNSYFDSAIMSSKTVPLATIPFASFSGMEFPKSRNVQVVKDGDVINLGDRELLVVEVPDHAVGSIAILDRKGRMLFAGDEVGMKGKDINTYVDVVAMQFRKLAELRADFEFVCHGHMGKMNADIIERVSENLEHILSGYEGEMESKPPFFLPEPEVDKNGNEIWIRNAPHPGDIGKKDPEEKKFIHVSEYSGCEVKFDIRRIRKTE